MADILVKTVKYPEIDVNFRDIDDRTPLFWAVVQKHKDIVELLLRAGADAEIKSKTGKQEREREGSRGERQKERCIVFIAQHIQVRRHCNML